MSYRPNFGNSFDHNPQNNLGYSNSMRSYQKLPRKLVTRISGATLVLLKLIEVLMQLI